MASRTSKSAEYISTQSFRLRLLGTLQILRQRRIPQILQMNAVECGAACLAMILSYYGRQTTVDEIRERCGIGRDGLSARSLARAAQSYGLRVRIISLPKNDFRYVRLPAIIHWGFEHFLVLESWSSSKIEVIDPAAGRLRISPDEFDINFTGIVILLEPGAHFIKGKVLPRLSGRVYLATCLKQAPWTLVQILLASFFLQAFGLSIPLLTKVVVDHIVPQHTQSIILILGLGICILFLAQLVTYFLRALLLVFLQTRVDLHMMMSFFEHLLTLPLRFFQVRSSGDILTRLASNTVIRDTLSTQLVSTVLDGGFVLVYLCILLWQSWTLGLLALGIGLLQVLFLLLTARPLHNLSMHELIAQGKAQGYVNEALGNIVSLKAAGAEQRAFNHWSNLFLTQLNISVRRNMLSACIESAITLLQTVSPLVFLWVGVIQVLHGSMQVGTMLALNVLAIAFLTPLLSLASSAQRLQLVRSHLERITDVLQAEAEQDTKLVRDPGKLTGRITLEHVSFRYDPESLDVLQDINLQIEPGQKIAIVGHTGSGKSTLGKILLGLSLPTQGEVFYDGQPLRSLNYQAVRTQFGVVMQETSVFSGTIRQNIAFNDPAMPLEQIIRAAELAAFHQDIQAMPMGYETPVSEQGSALSGGQRQRLVLARALAHSPALLLLDEATSSLDATTEKLVEQNLGTLSSTQIIIAHRLSTIRHADVILVLDAGTLVEQGTHHDLLKRNGPYARLVQNQSAPEEVSFD
ncbi:MAG TPA: peptidase domain-containing ABC transporter [Ktedonobacteraceae bacterium]|nr:peptidase domain-containing ABC transporter [Ktedonobacteraceae bacterium]